jgi:hypothetical protein
MDTNHCRLMHQHISMGVVLRCDDVRLCPTKLNHTMTRWRMRPQDKWLAAAQWRKPPELWVMGKGLLHPAYVVLVAGCLLVSGSKTTQSKAHVYHFKSKKWKRSPQMFNLKKKAVNLVICLYVYFPDVKKKF